MAEHDDAVSVDTRVGEDECKCGGDVGIGVAGSPLGAGGGNAAVLGQCD